jgi:hypothetical protein
MKDETKKSSGQLVAEDAVYFGILARGERVPGVLWDDHKMAKAALAASKVRGLRIVRTYVRIEIVGDSRRPPRRIPH